MFKRMLIVCGCLVLGAVVLARAQRSEQVPIIEPLATVPWQIAEWRGRPAEPLTDDILEVLGVDEYLNRYYWGERGRAAGLYVGYYQSQRQGNTMHSPLNCLPGSGWIPVKLNRITIPVSDRGASRQVEVNSVIIEKGIDRQAVIYWYQSQGRVVASEYWGKIYLVADAIRRNRTDGAMVRVIVPVAGRSEEADAAAEKEAIGFVQAVFPELARRLPA